ncbi:hypothetical protein V6S02_12725 [Microbacterium sp. CCNWLW134]|uniref:hypothetical protein n=1 Tax=Microbacterium sp. CCNWLW134 TaxID=3122064 RepID=UPI0030104C21
MTRPRLVLALAVLGAGAAVLAGCATPSGSSGTASASPTSSSSQSASPEPSSGGVVVTDDVEAAWLDGGRGVGLVTYGSSSCLPVVGEPTYADGVLTVDISDPEGEACTRDLVPRGSYVGVPEGVDPTRELEIVVTGTYADDTDLDGLEGEIAVPEEFAPSAGWADDDMMLILSWGSSTCAPVLESAEAAGSEVLVSFAEPVSDQVCTADMAPRVTVAAVTGSVDDDAPVTAVLSGGEFADIQVPVLGRA